MLSNVDGSDTGALDKTDPKYFLSCLGGGWPKNVSRGPVKNVTLFAGIILLDNTPGRSMIEVVPVLEYVRAVGPMLPNITTEQEYGSPGLKHIFVYIWTRAELSFIPSHKMKFSIKWKPSKQTSMFLLLVIYLSSCLYITDMVETYLATMSHCTSRG